MRSPFPRRPEAMRALAHVSRVIAQILLTRGWPGAKVVARVALAVADDDSSLLVSHQGFDGVSWYLGTSPTLESRPEKLPGIVGLTGLVISCSEQITKRLIAEEMTNVGGRTMSSPELDNLSQRYMVSTFCSSL